eukprot:5434900-Pleurochrysis_carterae.AAC.1
MASGRAWRGCALYAARWKRWRRYMEDSRRSPARCRPIYLRLTAGTWDACGINGQASGGWT